MYLAVFIGLLVAILGMLVSSLIGIAREKPLDSNCCSESIEDTLARSPPDEVVVRYSAQDKHLANHIHRVLKRNGFHVPRQEILYAVALYSGGIFSDDR